MSESTQELPEKVLSVEATTGRMLRMAALFAVFAAIYEGAYLLLSGQATLLELVTLGACLVVAVPMLFIVTRGRYGENALTQLSVTLFIFFVVYMLARLGGGLPQDGSSHRNYYYLIWLMLPFIFVVIMRPTRKAQILCWIFFLSFAAAVAAFLVITQRNPLLDPFANMLIQGVAAQAACNTLLYTFSAYHQRDHYNRIRIKALNNASEELVRTASEAEKARQTAEDAVTTRERFLAHMSHELRTPLNAIIGFSEILEREMHGAHSSPAYKEYAGDIKTSGQHLLGLINQILDYSRLSSGKADLAMSEIDLEEIIDEVIRLLRISAETKQLQLTFSCEETGSSYIVNGNAQALRQVTINLVSNAIKFTKEGSVTVHLSRNGDGQIVLEVRDTGCGMTPDLVAQAFEPFRRGVNLINESESGTGLGLSIVKSLIEAHDGSLALESMEGKGTIVVVVLPAACQQKHKDNLQFSAA